jgi:tRNA A-37 threonylcarbamoyl transferase component Bud32
MLAKAVRSLHHRGWLHGDLWAKNVIVSMETPTQFKVKGFKAVS